MYIALGIMLCGMLVGRMLGGRLAQESLRRWIFFAIMLLLFFLGVAVGSNERLVRDLPHLGGAALVLAFGAVSGTLVCAAFLRPRFKGESRFSRPESAQGPKA